MIKKIVERIVPSKIKKQLVNFKILAVDYAQYKTIKNWDCVDKNGNEIPWYTYPAIEYLNNLDFSDKNIFEYGSGNSSIFWSNKAKSVISIEHDKEWFEKVKLHLNKNQSLHLKDNSEEYEESILSTDKKFDVIVIDAIRRNFCAELIKNHINVTSEEGYLIILDNSDWYKNTAKYLRKNFDVIQVDFHGFGPINNYTWTTSVFFSRNFKFNVIEDIQPYFSIAAIEQTDD